MTRQLTQNPAHGLDVGRGSAHVFQVLQIQGNETGKGLGVNKVQALVGPPDLYQRKVMVPYLLDYGKVLAGQTWFNGAAKRIRTFTGLSPTTTSSPGVT